MKYEQAKLVLQRQLQTYKAAAESMPYLHQQVFYKAIITTYLKTLGNKFGYDATCEILNDAMITCPEATEQLNGAKILVKD